MVFYHYDFLEGSSRLNLRGQDKLKKLAPLLPASFNPIVVERTPLTPGLDEQRRNELLAQLSGTRFPIPPERISIGPPIAAGLTGFEALIVYGNQLSALAGGGAGGPGGVAGYAGTTGLSGAGLSPFALPAAGVGMGGGAGFGQ
jgi:hypothetical protein